MSDQKQAENSGLPKCQTGISGFDDITYGGLPKGRPTLVCGGAGSGKTLFGIEFLVKGITQYDEPGVLISFEETETEVCQNVNSFGWDLDGLIAKDKLSIDHILIERSEIEEAGEYNLEGLFIRIDAAIKKVNGQRIVLDTIESLFSGFTNESLLRAEIRRLFRWLKDRGLTAVITGEKGEKTFTRHGLEEYISDCVIFLDNRMVEQISTRRLRIIKYRGTSHGTNEYPFLLTENGFSVFPLTTLEMNYPVSEERVSSGIPRLDDMLGGEGFYKGSSILVSGTPGTGKTSIAASFVADTCARGERAIYFSFEESTDQIVRNMRSIGVDLTSYVENDLLTFQSVRSTTYGLETHLAMLVNEIDAINPASVVIDPISNFSSVFQSSDVKDALTRIIDYLKVKGITVLLTNLISAASMQETTEGAISSLMDTWILLRDIESNGERNRGLYVLKSRGMKHSNQIREFLISSQGIDLLDVYVGPGGVLTGTARATQEAEEMAATLVQSQKVERMRRELKKKEISLQNTMNDLQAQFEQEKEEIEQLISEAESRSTTLLGDRDVLGKMRGS